MCSLCCRLAPLCGAFSVFAILLLCLADPVWYSDRLVGNFVFLVCGLWQFFFASVISYVTFVLSLFVPDLSFFWCLWKVVLHDCGISWVCSHISVWYFLGMFIYIFVWHFLGIFTYFCVAFLSMFTYIFVWHFLSMFTCIFVWHFLGMVTYMYVLHFCVAFPGSVHLYLCVALPGYIHLYVCVTFPGYVHIVWWHFLGMFIYIFVWHFLSMSYIFVWHFWICSLTCLCGIIWASSLIISV